MMCPIRVVIFSVEHGSYNNLGYFKPYMSPAKNLGGGGV
jgi:hypothetical protein